MAGLIAEMRRLEPVGSRELPKPELDVTLLIPAKNSAHALEATVREAHRYLSGRYPGAFEIILIPNPGREGARDRSTEVAGELAKSHEAVRVVPHLGISGKGAALRTGFLEARGRWIFFTDADLPYDLDFFDEAATRLAQGYDLVTGNRRAPASQFEMPVELLRLAYGRHRLGLSFNRVVRALLPIRSRDTQAGIKALSRRLAEASFLSQKCPGFFFDLEIFLTAAGRGYAHSELPVMLHLNSEKSTVRLLRDSWLAAFWLGRIALGGRRGYYGRAARARGLPGRYTARGLTQAFLRLRWLQTPYARVASLIPPAGRVLDLGCGHGLLSLEAARQAPEREVLGVDHDEARIALATRAAEGLANVAFQALPMLPLPEGRFRSIFMIDVLH
ncbi:MAG TPA: glycosyltransferase [Bdellovibrionota bacterium]|nr:glycosyltransferase [Bdellovibrionota bacterium]